MTRGPPDSVSENVQKLTLSDHNLCYNYIEMMKLHFRIRNFCCAALLVFFGVFLAYSLTNLQPTVYADDEDNLITRQNSDDDYFVTIHDKESTLVVKAKSVTVAEVLEKSEVEVAETDIVEPSLDTVITSDFHINIYRARPALVIDGTHRRYIMTASHDPRQIATEAGLTIYDDDEVKMEFNTNFLEAGAVSTYRVTRNGGRHLTIEEKLPYEVQVRYDYTRPKGERVLEQPGEDGRKISVYEIEFENNIEVSRTLVEERTVVEAVPEIVVEGAMVSIPPEREQCANWAREAGVAEEDLEVALDLIYHESGCRIDATNASSGAYGIPQALPGTKMASVGDDWQTNPVTQIRWMIGYVNGRYGGWRQALDFWWCTGVCNGVNKAGYWY